MIKKRLYIFDKYIELMTIEDATGRIFSLLGISPHIRPATPFYSTCCAVVECRPVRYRLSLMILDAQQLSNAEMYKILIGSVAPRPIAWAGTRSKDGINNLAPFSFYNCFSSTPPIVGFSPIPRPDGRKKDTLQNVQDSKCFTLSCASFKLAKEMSKSSATLEPGEDEFLYSGLTAAEALHINAPFVAEALLVFECQLREIISFGNEPGSGNLILGEIKHIHIDDSIYENGRIDIDKLDPVGRLAGNWYSTVRDRFELQRG